MSTEEMNAICNELLESCALRDGQLTLGDDVFAAFGARIQGSAEKRSWGVALIALCNRLRGVPGAGPAAERVLALAALALGDNDLNQLMKKSAAKA